MTTALLDRAADLAIHLEEAVTLVAKLPPVAEIVGEFDPLEVLERRLDRAMASLAMLAYEVRQLPQPSSSRVPRRGP